MRELLRIRTLCLAGPAGLLVALSCVPYVSVMSGPGALRSLQLSALAPISVVLMQISLAWTPHERRVQVLCSFDSTRRVLVLLVVGLGLSCLARVLLDPLISSVLPGYFPRSSLRLVLSLPWVGLFQPLFLVASVYAFAHRLTGRPLLSIAAVVLAHQGILFLQIRGLSTGILPVLVLAAGIYGLILGWSYRAHGLCGPALIAVLSQVRHVLRFM